MDLSPGAATEVVVKALSDEDESIRQKALEIAVYEGILPEREQIQRLLLTDPSDVSAALTDEARAILEKHALWLQGHRDLKVTVEGHCDERGTVEYNLALGEQRARVTRDYLVSLGVAAERLRAVSFGKERPLDPGTGEAAWAKNRRAHFAVSR